MTRFRRGFKAESERLALEVREGVGAGPYGRLAPARVAEDYGIPLLELSALVSSGGASRIVDERPAEDPAEGDTAGDGGSPDSHDGGDLHDDVSAVTVMEGPRRLIVVNDGMSRVRQRSAVAHELAHILLEHEPSGIADGRRQWQPAVEAEADWLAGCLLVPKGAAIGCAMAGMSDRAVAARYGTSVALARWRMNVTAARLIARRAGTAGSSAAAS